METYRLLADGILVVHAGYAIFVVLMLPLILIGAVRGWGWVRNIWLRITHLVMMVFVGMEAAIGVPCPLTDLERIARAKAGQEPHASDFLVYWMDRLLFIDMPAWIFDLGHVLFSILLIALFLLVPPRWPGRARPAASLQLPAA